MFQTRSLVGSADALAAHLDGTIARGSVSASIEHSGELSVGDARVVLRTYERYSITGSNRVTLSVTILAVGDRLEVALTTSGGSEAVFFKLNTFGESAFMDKAVDAIDAFA
ncbi:DUF6054 family protein [Demequina aestuarii]|uniref:DUF6054 family protein n=1 Tax=Demequina aestuarii TaxID=327095 RepID=UPI0007808372|nr:DUF6054 family protein [Demequina aestuarii]